MDEKLYKEAIENSPIAKEKQECKECGNFEYGFDIKYCTKCGDKFEEKYMAIFSIHNGKTTFEKYSV